MTIIDPKTGTSLDHPKLLSMLMEWTGEGRILEAMMKARRGSPSGLAYLAALVKVTSDQDDTQGLQQMDERLTAACVVSFLLDASVRNTVARYVALAHQVDYRDVQHDLYGLRVNLMTEYRLRPNLIPRFVAEEQGKQLLMADGTGIDLEPKPLPQWAESYQALDQDITPEAAEWLRSLPEPHREVIRRFPPGCLVRATIPCQLPAPGEVALCIGLVGFDDGTVGIGVASDPGPEAMTGECRSDWLECVGYLGAITPERVAQVLDGEAVTNA